MEFLDSTLTALVYLTSAFVLFLIGRIIYGVINKRVKVVEELIIKDNLAFSLAHTGYLIGLICVIGGAVVGPSDGLINDVIQIMTYGIVGIIFLNIAIIINDKLILSKFKVYDEIITQQNAGTGIVEAASSIATGLILFASISGESFTQYGIVSVIVFGLAGQIILILTSWVYNLITPYDIHDHIEKNNVAVGIGFAGAIIAIGNLIRFGLSGDFDGWQDLSYSLIYDVTLGLIFLPIARFICDKLLLPGQKLTNEIVNQDKPNIGAAIIEAFCYIGGSILITWSL